MPIWNVVSPPLLLPPTSAQKSDIDQTSLAFAQMPVLVSRRIFAAVAATVPNCRISIYGRSVVPSIPVPIIWEAKFVPVDQYVGYRLVPIVAPSPRGFLSQL